MQPFVLEPVNLAELSPAARAALLYEYGDREPVGSEERARWYAAAAEAAQVARRGEDAKRRAQERRERREAERQAWLRRYSRQGC